MAEPVVVRRRDGPPSRSPGSRPSSGVLAAGVLDRGATTPGVASTASPSTGTGTARSGDATSGVQVAQTELRRLRLYILRAAALSLMAYAVLRSLSSTPTVLAEYPLSATRLGVVVVGMGILAVANEHNNHAIALFLIIAVKAVTLVRYGSYIHSPAGLVLTCILGPGRVLPAIATFLHSPRLGVVLALTWIGEVLFLSSGLATSVLASSDSALPVDTSPFADLAEAEPTIVVAEIGYTIMLTTMATAFAWSFEEALSRLGDTLDRRRVFISNINHELRTPLVGVIGLADILVSSEGLSMDLLQQLEIIRASGKAVLSLINNMLDLARIDANALHLERRPVRVRDFTSRVADTFAAMAKSKGIALRVHVQPDVPDAILLDDLRMQQVLGNLLGNAFKFTHTGHIEIAVWMAPVNATEASGNAVIAAIDPRWAWPSTVPLNRPGEEARDVVTRIVTSPTSRATTAATQAGARGTFQRVMAWMDGTAATGRGAEPTASVHVCFAVRDTGIGVKANAVAGLFEPFQQADSSTARQYGGSGLGLSICRELAVLQGSYLVVRTQVGVGSAFLFSVPLVAVDAALAPPSQPQPQAFVDAVFVASRLQADPTASDAPALHSTEVPATTSAAAMSPPHAAAPPEARMPDLAARISVETDSGGLPRSELSSASLNSIAGLSMHGSDAPSGRPTVLLVEDNPLNANVLTRQLQMLGCETVWVQDGILAVETYTRLQAEADTHEDGWLSRPDSAEPVPGTPVAAGSPDRRLAVPAEPEAAASPATAVHPPPKPIHAVLMDLNMPNMSGVEATRILRERERERAWPRVPIIALTADDRSLHGSECEEAGMDDFLSKPTTMQALEDVLGMYMVLSRQSRGRSGSTLSDAGAGSKA